MSKAVKIHDEKDFVLPASVIGRPDVTRLLREIEKVDYELEAQAVRQPGQPLAIPNVSRGLAETAQNNAVAIDSVDARRDLLAKLRTIKEHAPLMHVTFAAEAEPEEVSVLVLWVRENLHPAALITVGLQPSIVGGCVIRTPDHIYDFSFRNKFKQQLPELAQYVRAIATKTA